MGLTRDQLLRLRKMIQRKAQPRRKLRGGIKSKNPQPQPYPKIKTGPKALEFTRADLDKIQELMADVGLSFREASQLYARRQNRKP